MNQSQAYKPTIFFLESVQYNIDRIIFSNQMTFLSNDLKRSLLTYKNTVIQNGKGQSISQYASVTHIKYPISHLSKH